MASPPKCSRFDAFVEACRTERGRRTLLFLLCLIVAMLYDITQILLAFLGAITYAVLRARPFMNNNRGNKAAPSGMAGKLAAALTELAGPLDPRTQASWPARAQASGAGALTFRPRRSRTTSWQPDRGRSRPNGHCLKLPPVGPSGGAGTAREGRQVSTRPVKPLEFSAQGWEGEVQELLGQITPSIHSDKVLQAIVEQVEQQLGAVLPEVRVHGVVHAEVLSDARRGLGAAGTAFGVAVPDVEVVVCVPPEALTSRLALHLERDLRSSSSPAAKSARLRKLHKVAIRVFTEVLVATGGFKFRRSAFRSPEPKVTLLAPAVPGVSEHTVPMDFTVNAQTPSHLTSLVSTVDLLHPHAKALIMLVRRWAKDRGLCHAARGHLSTYSWAILTIFFLQVGVDADSALPSLSRCGDDPQSVEQDTADRTAQVSSSIPSISTLFADFFLFYSKSFDFSREAVSIRLGERGGVPPALPLHIVVCEVSGARDVGPNIEDPFDTSSNLGHVMSYDNLARLRAEFARAAALVEGDLGSAGKDGDETTSVLGALLRPWTPPCSSTPSDNEETARQNAPRRPPGIFVSRDQPTTEESQDHDDDGSQESRASSKTSASTNASAATF